MKRYRFISHASAGCARDPKRPTCRCTGLNQLYDDFWRQGAGGHSTRAAGGPDSACLQKRHASWLRRDQTDQDGNRRVGRRHSRPHRRASPEVSSSDILQIPAYSAAWATPDVGRPLSPLIPALNRALALSRIYWMQLRDRRVQRASAAGNWMVGPPSSWSLRDQENASWQARFADRPHVGPSLVSAESHPQVVTGQPELVSRGRAKLVAPDACLCFHLAGNEDCRESRHAIHSAAARWSLGAGCVPEARCC